MEENMAPLTATTCNRDCKFHHEERTIPYFNNLSIVNNIIVKVYICSLALTGCQLDSKVDSEKKLAFKEIFIHMLDN